MLGDLKLTGYFVVFPTDAFKIQILTSPNIDVLKKNYSFSNYSNYPPNSMSLSLDPRVKGNN